MPSMHRRPRRIPRDMHHDAREIVLAPVLLWCQDLREPNATPVVALVLPVQTEEGPLHGDEEHRRQPIPERVLGRIATASILTCPLCLAEMRIFRTRFRGAFDALDLPPEQLLQVDVVLKGSAHILHVDQKDILQLTTVICNEFARLANCPIPQEDPEDMLLHRTAFPKRPPLTTRRREDFRGSEGLDSVSEKGRRITLARPQEVIRREIPLSRGPCQRSHFVRPNVRRGEGGSLIGESAYGAAVAVARTALLYVRVDDSANRLHPKEHLRDRIHEARVCQVGNATSTAAPLQLMEHVLTGTSVGFHAQVAARRQRSQHIRHVARLASGHHGSHLVSPVSRSSGRASATPSTAPAT